MPQTVLKDMEDRMNKAILALKKDLSSLRAGRANPAMLDRVMVDYYGTPTPISQLANISVPEPRMLTIQPWDKTALKEIDRALQQSDLGISPSNDGVIIRLVIPPLTEERRKELVKLASKGGEEAKVAIAIFAAMRMTRSKSWKRLRPFPRMNPVAIRKRSKKRPTSSSQKSTRS